MITTILLMAAITFGSRYLFLHHALPFRVGAKMQRFLSFSAPAVLTAIWVPIVVLPGNQWQLSYQNPYLVAALVAIITAYKSHSIYATTLLSMAVFFALR
ncbi:AzlD domain-containing protein [Pseudoalteromonas sp. T1lg76]|uniref:AzlD domain-containing protein n=1 Tax=Pseudoalteromonas sp. T1lg76 TaxID=2077103 RepID=UPI000CF6A162|nr:AzlD domain-containing protein [Pseudoalteromonas sp. T1lg76]